MASRRQDGGRASPYGAHLLPRAGQYRRATGMSSVWRVAPSVRVSPPGDGHACCYGNAGGQCLVIEPLAMLGDLDEVPTPHAPTIVRDDWIIELAARVYTEMRADGPHSVSGLVIESIALEVLAQCARRERRRAERCPPCMAPERSGSSSLGPGDRAGPRNVGEGRWSSPCSRRACLSRPPRVHGGRLRSPPARPACVRAPGGDGHCRSRTSPCARGSSTRVT
jgi:hypothetical protein